MEILGVRAWNLEGLDVMLGAAPLLRFYFNEQSRERKPLNQKGRVKFHRVVEERSLVALGACCVYVYICEMCDL